jgi:hypothetical protein
MKSGRACCLENRMTANQTFDGYVRGKLSLFKALLAFGHQITDLSLRTAIVMCLPKEMEACKESLQTNILGKSQTEIIELFTAIAAGRKFNDMVPTVPVPTAKVTAVPSASSKPQLVSQPKPPSSIRPRTPNRRFAAPFR